jgi:hypothetical protein
MKARVVGKPTDVDLSDVEPLVYLVLMATRLTGAALALFMGKLFAAECRGSRRHK